MWYPCIELHLRKDQYGQRLGIMLLQNGLYSGKQIVPADYFEHMYTHRVTTLSKNDPETREGYGYQVWKCTPEDTYRADGVYGQFCIIMRSYNAVVTVSAHSETEHNDILRSKWKDLLPQLQKVFHDKEEKI